MAQRRMFSLKIIDTDNFLEMPISARELYFQFGMRADDDGFVGNPRRIMKMIGASDDDLKVLIAKRFLIPFNSGICVISDWKIHNYIQKDRYQETQFKSEKAQLDENENGKYLLNGEDNPKQLENVSKMDTQVRVRVRSELGKDSNKDVGNKKEKPKNTPLKEIVNYFFELKGWDNKDKSFYDKKEIVYSRFTKPAKDLLELCEGNIAEAKGCLKKISDWATSRSLDWSIETTFKKWYDIDILKPKEKKPHYNGYRIFQKNEGGKWYIVKPDGIKELGITPRKEEIEYK